MIKKALLGALTEKAQEKKVAVVTGGDKATGKTKEAQKLREKMGDLAIGPVVVVTAQQRDMARGWRNLKGVKVVERERLNTYEILAHKSMVITQEAMEELVKLCP
jgi:ribosomal protein L4